MTHPTLQQAAKIWAKIGLLSFGGPAAQIALMHTLIVEKTQWLKEQEFLNALSFCMLLPGPEAMQLATYAGWRLHGKLGGLIAGLLFVLPGAIVIFLLAWMYAALGEIPVVQALFIGVKAAVLVIVIESLLRISKRALKASSLKILAVLTFIAIFFLHIPFPLIVIAAGVFGFLTTQRTAPLNLRVNANSKTNNVTNANKNAIRPQGFRPLIVTVAVMLCIWWLPLISVDIFFSEQKILSDLGAFFSKLAVVTFGGAYAVLAYMGQDVVNHWGWLNAGEMMDGLGLAETTPGPLILVTEFVGFLAAYREGGLGLGIAGTIVTLWATFIPCFLWIFAGAPYIEWICAQPKLKGALEAISAAVVGVILNLSIWFALHVTFSSISIKEFGPVFIMQPDINSVDWRIVSLTLLCAFMLLKCHWSVIKVLFVASILGVSTLLFN